MNLLWADLHRDVVMVEGEDAGSFLHSQLANDVHNLELGATVQSLLLEPTGHVHSLVRVVRRSHQVYTLDVEGGFGGAVIARLGRYVLRSKVVLTESDWLVRSFRGADAGGALRHAVACARVGWGDGDAIDVIDARGSLPDIGDGVEPGHVASMDTDSRWPRLGVDVLAGDIPATSGILPVAVSFTKGCYPGQELVERMDSRGTSAPVVVKALSRGEYEVGDRVFEGGRDVGEVTSVGFTTALARVARGSTVGEPLR